MAGGCINSQRRYGWISIMSMHWAHLQAHAEFTKMKSDQNLTEFIGMVKWSWREESNLQPAVYKTAALPIELRQPGRDCDERNPINSAPSVSSKPLSIIVVSAKSFAARNSAVSHLNIMKM